LEVVVNDNLSWRMLLIVRLGLTFWTALPCVTIIAMSLVILLRFLLRTRRAHISRKRKGSPLIRMNPSPKIMQLVSNRNVTLATLLHLFFFIPVIRQALWAVLGV